jgi:hypothetical protein
VRWDKSARAVAALGALASTAPLAGCGEEPPAIEITFTNGTDRRVVMMVLRPGTTVADKLEERQILPATHEPGASWRHNASVPRGGEPPDGQWCEPLITYVFLSPKDPNVRSRGVSQQNDPQLSSDELDEVDRLSTPCWQTRTGNEYTIGHDGIAP